jgi:hypothetical protein
MELTPKQIKKIEKELKDVKRSYHEKHVTSLDTDSIKSLYEDLAGYLDEKYVLVDESDYGLQVYERIPETDEEFENRKERLKLLLEAKELKRLQEFEQFKKELE